MTRIAFLDRDGVLNEDDNYVIRPDQFRWMPEAKEAVRWLNEEGFKVVVVTNQSGIGRGLYTEDDFAVLTEWMERELAEIGAHLDDVYFCPHHPVHASPPYLLDCDCRKPKPGMLLKALEKYKSDPGNCFLIGDAQRDIDAAIAAGVHGQLYAGGSLLEAVRRAALTVR